MVSSGLTVRLNLRWPPYRLPTRYTPGILLSPGTRLGPYEILTALGAGGMGEVYRARDAKLNRDVAIKVLLPAVANDPDRLARFSREAQVLASLNHPNIAAIYGLETAPAGDGRTEVRPYAAIVMELVEGEDLSQRIARGAIPLDEALPIARQIAEALEAAHEQGIIHRDLKPANIKVRADGTVKVLDFGLAKAIEQAASRKPQADLATSPTLSIHATEAGTILGTAAYMSPEQARGKAVDKRADIWSLGVIVYEMLTGRHAFAGEELSDILAAVLRQEIDWSALPPTTPSRLRRLLERCLDRDPRSRLRDAGEARVEIARLETSGGNDEVPAAPLMVRSRSPLAWLALPIVAIASVAAGWSLKPVTNTAATHLSIALPPGEQVTTFPAISRDGRTVAYVAGRTASSSQLYLRSLDDFTAHPVADSAGAIYPFFSPDGRSIAFFAGGKLQRAAVTGGAPKFVAAVGAPWGGTWTDDDRMVFSTMSGGLWSVPAIGGSLQQLTKTDGGDAGYAHTFPERLPGTTDLLFSFWGRQFNMSRVDTETGAWRAITPDSEHATGTSTHGYVFVHDGAGGVRAVAWTPDTTAVVHPETVVLDNVYWTAGVDRPWLSVADNGTAVYVPGDSSNRHLVWVDRRGQVTQLPGEPAQISHASVSPDGRRVAYGNATALWVLDLATGARTRILSDVGTLAAAWMPDSQRLAVSSNSSGDWEIYTVGISGQSELTPLLKKPFVQHPLDVAPDGTIIAFERHPETGADLWTISPDGKASPLVVTKFNELSARVSADGRYVAYVSNESGRNEVYAVPLSGKGDRISISLGGGTGPVWSRDGRELFYRDGDDLISVDVKTAPTLVLGERRKLLDLSAYDPAYFHQFDVSADGQRFLLIRTDPASRPVRLNVMLNWVETLKTKVLAK